MCEYIYLHAFYKAVCNITVHVDCRLASMCDVYKLFKCTLYKAINKVWLFSDRYMSIYTSMYIVLSLLQGKVVSLQKKTSRSGEQFSLTRGQLKRNYLRSTFG